ncbi:glycosyltransferase family 9 protein [Magnetospirillum moscoviense]|uniref:Glycosyl transferase n=1 Tax=Magnetospirillum moscoviense TaxID=1437059 RepID=A0A178MWA7_9PROT|nr:glycosyltransferase family 9 protein [Magnetospirillum moscoviense]OAN55112.1 glycosyl transferase [Magnetospirillum moscoviense]
MRILFVTASRIGDAVLSTGLLAYLARQYPQARFWVACGAPAAPLFAAAPFVERVIPMVKQRRSRHWLELWKLTVGHRWQMVVDLRGSALGWLLPTLKRSIIKSSWEEQHRLVHLAGVLGLDTPQAPVVWTTPAQDDQAARLLPAGPQVLAVGPTANWGGKQWPAENFADLVARLTVEGGILPGACVAVFGAASERASVQALLDRVPPERLIDLIGTVDLGTVPAVLKRAAFYVGNDSGLMHIAAATGLPTLGLFGPSSEVFYGPWGEHCASVRGPRSFTDICHAPDYDYKSQECLMRDLSVDKVSAAAEALWVRAVGRQHHPD